MALLVFALSGSACAKFQTARECGTFMDSIKTWKSQAAPVSTTPVTSPADASIEALALAKRYDDLSQRIDALRLTSPDLKPRAERYQKLAREAAKSLRDVADAVEKGDSAGARKRRVQFDDIARGEAPLVAEINGVCR